MISYEPQLRYKIYITVFLHSLFSFSSKRYNHVFIKTLFLTINPQNRIETMDE